jgi:hypothetical protein
MLRFHVHKSPRLVSVMSQLNPAHTLPRGFFNFNNIHLSTSRYSKLSLQARNLYILFSSPVRVTCPAHLINDFLSFKIFRPIYFTTLSVSETASVRMIGE